MAILGHYIFKLPVGMLMVLINAPLLLLGTKYFGKHFTIRSIIAIGFTSLCIDLMVEFLHINALSHDVILAAIFVNFKNFRPLMHMLLLVAIAVSIFLSLALLSIYTVNFR